MEHMAEDYATGIARQEEWHGMIIEMEMEIENKESETVDKVSDNIFANIQKYQHEEYQYLHLLENILENGTWEEGRNGRTKSIFGHSMRFSLQNGKIPILTTKKTAWKTCLKELLWFIRGETDNRLLKEQGVHIWDANASREFLDSRGLTITREDLIGPGYGYQWRQYNANYNCYTGKRLLNDDPKDIHKNRLEFKGIDQLKQIIDALKDPKQRTSRRLIMTAWNPCQLDQMALPPCHILCQFNVKNGDQLSCAMFQRSNDEFLGSCFNIASYSFLTHLLAKHCGLKAHEFVYFKGDCHIYENAIDACKLQITREPYPFPTVSIEQVRENINDYQVEDFKVHNYKHHEAIKVAMVA
jgi:thymidylate synthase